MKLEKSFPLISASFLSQALNDPNLRDEIVILDAVFCMPDSGKNAHQEYLNAHIPKARFFDIDAIKDHENDLPHMVPKPDYFRQIVNAMGIDNNKLVICYDHHGFFSAARCWWLFHIFGHKKVGILDGGLRAWQALDFPIETGEPPPPEEFGDFKANFLPDHVVDKTAVMQALHKTQIVDMRSRPRFLGEVDEPRPGLRSGHMPGAINLPFNEFSDAKTGYIKPLSELKSLIQGAGIDPNRELITSCGSGITAATLNFVLYLMGYDQAKLYDGSWTQWGLDPTTPIEKG